MLFDLIWFDLILTYLFDLIWFDFMCQKWSASNATCVHFVNKKERIIQIVDIIELVINAEETLESNPLYVVYAPCLFSRDLPDCKLLQTVFKIVVIVKSLYYRHADKRWVCMFATF